MKQTFSILVRGVQPPESGDDDMFAKSSPLRATAPITATWSSGSGGLLSVHGNGDANSINLGRNASGMLFVNDGSVKIQGGKPSVVNTSLIQVYGQSGNDVVIVDESNGLMPRANLYGGDGNDRLVAGSAADHLFGQIGNDTLEGRAGDDLLFGGAGDDVLTGGDGNDQLYGEAGNDRFVWNPGDDSDLVEGGSGIDSAEVNGGNGTEQFSVTANAGRVRLDRIDPAPFALDIGSTERLVLAMGGGDDSFAAAGNIAALIQLDIDGGAGNDSLAGGNGADTLAGGEGADVVDGNQGNDVARLGAGDDLFQWDPGDGNDSIDGGAGSDTLQFNGSNIAETMTMAAASDGHLHFTRDVAAITLDLDAVEAVRVNASGGADEIDIADLAATDVASVLVNLAANGGSAGDGQADSVTVQGSATDDTINVAQGIVGGLIVGGLAAAVQVTGHEAIDGLVIRGGGGNDSIGAAALNAGLIRLVIHGGDGSDSLTGSRGADLLVGGDGDDSVFWNAADGGDDIVEGQSGADRVVASGHGAAEAYEVTATTAGRVRLVHDLSATLDIDDIEQLQVLAGAGSDSIIVGDVAGSDVQQLVLNLGDGTADGALDRVTRIGTQADDAIIVAGSGGTITVSGLVGTLRIEQADASDELAIAGLAGNDQIDASALAAGQITLRIDGGLGIDAITGSAGDDLVTGGDGNDSVLMGPGDDRFVWNPGDDNDSIGGGAGWDALLVNGTNIAETIDVVAGASHALFTRDVAAVALDLDEVESVQFMAAGGSDLIRVGDLSATAVEELRIDLGTAAAEADGQADSVFVYGSDGDDAITIHGEGDSLVIYGLAATVFIERFEFGRDVLVVLGAGGNDVLDASVLGGGMHVWLDGGGGDDILLGGGGDDVLDGGEGDDVLLGGAGVDVLLNGEISIQGLMAPPLEGSWLIG